MEEDKMAELYRLMTDELFATITNEEGNRLSTLLQEPWARVEWEKFQKTFESQDVIDKVAQLIQEDTGAIGLQSAIRKRTRNRQLVRAGAVSAVVFIGLFGWHYLSTNSHRSPALSVAKGIQLQLADGQTIDLSAVQTLTAGNTVIHNDTNHRQLSYTAAAHSVQHLNTLKVPVGMDYRIRLSDGTEVFLNSATQLSFPFAFDGPKREITITGEAFLKVAKDAAKPFIVHLPTTDVEVLGTSFNVNTYDAAAVKVSLQEGSVQLVSPGQKTTRLQPGSQAVCNTTRNETEVKSFSPDELSWIKGAYILDNTPLDALTVIFPRWFGIEVVIDNPGIAKERFTGTILRSEPIDTFLRTLERTAGVTTYYRDSVLHIK
jgi:ferric-dicitrate binding protein FerR (iron transport regulator)